MDSTATTGEIRVDVFVRSLRPQGRYRCQRRVLDRLDALVEEGVIDGFDVFVWGASAPATPEDARTQFGRHVLDRVATFREWARTNSRSMTAVFDIQEVDSSITDERYRRLALPAIIMAEYHDGRLACVTPHERGGETVPVRDRVIELGIRPESVADLVATEDDQSTASPFRAAGAGGRSDQIGEEIDQTGGRIDRTDDESNAGSSGDDRRIERRQ